MVLRDGFRAGMTGALVKTRLVNMSAENKVTTTTMVNHASQLRPKNSVGGNMLMCATDVM